MIKKVFVFAILILTIFSKKTIASQTIEEDAAPSEVSQKQEEIEALREEVQKRVKEKLDTILNDQKRRGWIGVIEEKGETGFEIKSNDQIRSVTIAADVVIIDQKRAPIEFGDLETGQRVMALGYEQIDGVLEAKRIIVTPEPEKRETQVIFILIDDTSEEEQLLSVTDNQQNQYQLMINKDTLIKSKDNMAQKGLKYSALESSQKIIAIISPTKSNGSTFNAIQILILSENTPEEPANEEEAQG